MLSHNPRVSRRVGAVGQNGGYKAHKCITVASPHRSLLRVALLVVPLPVCVHPQKSLISGISSCSAIDRPFRSGRRVGRTLLVARRLYILVAFWPCVVGLFCSLRPPPSLARAGGRVVSSGSPVEAKELPPDRAAARLLAPWVVSCSLQRGLSMLPVPVWLLSSPTGNTSCFHVVFASVFPLPLPT